jgi:pyruvate dehydrogenase E1 component beta subunit
MPIDVLMPALSPTMEEGKLSKWVKKVGDKVKAGDVIAEIETDKATMEVEAADEGTLASVLVPEGTENVKVNTPIALLAAEGETVSAAAPAKAAPETPAPHQAAPATQQSARPPEMKAEGMPKQPPSVPAAPHTPALADPDVPGGY